ncbi:MAG: formylglycine-generating enzyme family protein [Polyangiaceae bacterium]|jgi:formylglycine-generating enzyme required for sulfatase activity|nr:formylglycine-generating enzyme family protein [Polyangiaceae bacterium]
MAKLSTRWIAPVALASCLGILAGRCKTKSDGDDKSEATREATPEQVASAAAAAATQDPGPRVNIPAGTLTAGTPCQKTPRITNEELEAVRLEMGAFDIDVYPYPNDPAQVPRTGVSRIQAEALCRERGRRLCTELEWERACKGGSNSTYPYGDDYRPKACDGEQTFLRAAGSYDACQSAFGVKAIYGAVWEWTASEWGRGGPGGLAAVRGGGHSSPVVRTRCANGQSRAPAETSADLGFRCCGGPVNSAAVQLEIDKRDPLVADASVDQTLASRLFGGLPPSMRSVDGFKAEIDQIWRWHPRANEEMIVARYRARRLGGIGEFHHPVVFHLCGAAIVRSAMLRGPVERMAPPAVSGSPQRATVQVDTGQDSGEVEFRYRYGDVSVMQPSWIKEGNSLDVGRTVRVMGPRPRLRIPGRGNKEAP